MRLVELIPDADVVCALEPYELGLRMLPALAAFQARTPLYHTSQLGFRSFADATLGTGPQPVSQYPAERSPEIELAIREAWCWLEGAALVVTHPRYKDPARQLSRRARQLALEPNPQRAISAHRLAKDTLHPVIREDVWALYHRGKAAELRAFMADLDPASLPSVAEAKAQQHARHPTQEREPQAEHGARREEVEPLAPCIVSAAARQTQEPERNAEGREPPEGGIPTYPAPSENASAATTTRSIVASELETAKTPEPEQVTATAADHELRSAVSIASGIMGGLAKITEAALGMLSGLFDTPVRLTPDEAQRNARAAEEAARLAEFREHVAKQERELSAINEQISEQQQEKDFAARYGIPAKPVREQDDDRGRDDHDRGRGRDR